MASTTQPATSTDVGTFEPWDADGIKWVSREEGIAILDRQARKYLGMSGEEFVRMYRAGELVDDCSDVTRLSMLIPLGYD
ncbi:MAG: hypothetical protein QOF33_3658 [Thermomicrobiales bacterium]|jgi:hypothetical protein|nr:hypothetical protein [Thermomicrobiales bacterium]